MIQELLTLRLQQMMDIAYYSTKLMYNPHKLLPNLAQFVLNGFQVDTTTEQAFGMSPFYANTLYGTVLGMGIYYAGYYALKTRQRTLEAQHQGNNINHEAQHQESTVQEMNALT